MDCVLGSEMRWLNLQRDRILEAKAHELSAKIEEEWIYNSGVNLL